jgi:predicted nucleotidyltransferase
MIDIIERNRSELTALCRKHHVKSLEIFGSATEEKFDLARSDFDFLLEFLPAAAGRPFYGYFDLKEDLEKLFGRKVDLVMPSAIRNPYFLKAVNRQRTVLYAA